MDEIRRLQEELQRAQQSGSLHRLSERNCIQLIIKLKEMNLIDVGGGEESTNGKCMLAGCALFIVPLHVPILHNLLPRKDHAYDRRQGICDSRSA